MKISLRIVALLVAVAVTPAAGAHAFPENSSPHVGATVTTTPSQVKVWFDAEIEPTFSTLLVKNATGKQVSRGRGEVDKADHTLLEASLPATLPAGKYEVYWSVIAHDGHHTAGHFTFTLQ